MEDADRYRLIGSYSVPATRVGGTIYDRLKGKRVTVGSWHATEFGLWPCAGRTGTVLIVDDSLLAAIETEASIAVAHHWRVCVHTAARWRKRAGVGSPTQVQGTQALYRGYAPEKVAAAETRVLMRAAIVATDAARRSGAARKGRTLPRPDGWTPEEDAICRAHPLAECCRRLPGRTRTAISIRRSRLKQGAAND